MRRLGAACLAGLWLGVFVSMAAAQSGDKGKPDQPSSWWGGLFGGGSREEAKKADSPAGRPVTVVDKAAEQKRLESAYFRRQEACFRLLEIAQQKNDPRLEEEANRLNELAEKLYRQQTGRLLGVRVMDPTEALDSGASASSARVLQGASGGSRRGGTGPDSPSGPSQASQSPTKREGLR